MTDPSKRPLQFPVWHIPYLEKHRIYGLFIEIARELVIQKPDDHVLFMKQILQNAANSRDVSRIILIQTPKVNCLEVANEISKVTGQIVISEKTVSHCIGRSIDEVPFEIIAQCLAYLVRSEGCYQSGWIMVDCIRSEADAKQLLRRGILPTHVIHLIAPFHPDLSNIIYCNVKSNWPNYRRNIVGIRNIFKKVLKEIYLGHRHMIEIVSECINLTKMPQLKRTITPRIVLLGPRGCGRKTQARMLVSSMGLVHIDFEYLICQAWISASELGEKLRQCKNEVCFHSELLSQVVNKRILEHDCLEKGWVLTGYPYTETDMRYLDSLDTPPNRVIFLECDLNICKERIANRKINVFTGSKTNMTEHPNAEEEKILKTHPKDNNSLIDAELEYYCQNYGALRKYCGASATVLNSDQNERWINECITAIVLNVCPPGPPREGISDVESSVSTINSSCDCVVVPSKVMDCFIRKI